jgi:GrpB-like predicted nucleotidyltransferase (UPF0157 family)
MYVKFHLMVGDRLAFRTRIVEIVPYDPTWKAAFEKLQALLMSIVGDLALRIEHVGSTAVEGLAAKPIIDIDVVIESMALFPAVKDKLERAGCNHLGDLGVEGREAFSYDQPAGTMPCHLYVCPQDGKGYREHIALRDYLRQHPEVRDAYASLKRSLAEKYRYDVDSYCESKTAFIEGILKQTFYDGG